MEGDKKRKTYDREFKVNAVTLVTEGGRKVREVARELGIDPNTLYHWKRELWEEQEGAFPGKGHLGPLEEENRKLRRKLAEAKEDREILKKALAYFSKHGK
jgi:transposase